MSKPNSNNTCVTTTAMPRPELLEITYNSFQKNIPWLSFKDMTLYLNIDKFPTDIEGDMETKIEKTIATANKYFGNVIVNIGYSCFPKAVKWVFSSANKDFVLNLEDDWELLCEVPSYFQDFFENPDIMQVGLRAWKKSDPRFVLSPSILRTSFCNKVASLIHDFRNPEEQIRGVNPYNNKLSKHFIYWPYESEKVILKDMGREWLRNSIYGKDGCDFTKWRFLPNIITRAREQIDIDQNKEINLAKLDGFFGDNNVSY